MRDPRLRCPLISTASRGSLPAHWETAMWKALMQGEAMKDLDNRKTEWATFELY